MWDKNDALLYPKGAKLNAIVSKLFPNGNNIT